MHIYVCIPDAAVVFVSRVTNGSYAFCQQWRRLDYAAQGQVCIFCVCVCVCVCVCQRRCVCVCVAYSVLNEYLSVSHSLSLSLSLSMYIYIYIIYICMHSTSKADVSQLADGEIRRGENASC
jgi:hypothetical protein